MGRRYKEIMHAMEDAAADSATRVAVLTGKGPYYCAGEGEEYKKQITLTTARVRRAWQRTQGFVSLTPRV